LTRRAPRRRRRARAPPKGSAQAAVLPYQEGEGFCHAPFFQDASGKKLATARNPANIGGNPAMERLEFCPNLGLFGVPGTGGEGRVFQRLLRVF
jgi:hypothetical protein